MFVFLYKLIYTEKVNPSILFLNGPENEAKKQLCKMLQLEMKEYVCIYLHRKDLIKMFNVDAELTEDSYEWIIQKLLKTFVLNGTFVIFDGFLPTRRIGQYIDSLDGLPAYWIGIFFKGNSEDYNKDFYDFSVILDEELTVEENTFELEAQSIVNFVSKNDPICYPPTKSVDYVARKRTINKKDHSNDRAYISNDIEGAENEDKDFELNDNNSENIENDFIEEISKNTGKLSEEKAEESGFERSERRNFDRSDCPMRDREDRPRREGDRPRGGFGDRPRSGFGGRSGGSSFGNREGSSRDGGFRSDRPREGGDRPRGGFGDRPRSGFGGRSGGSSFGNREGSSRDGGFRSDRPREGGDRPRGGFGDRPRSGFGGRSGGSDKKECRFTKNLEKNNNK